MPAAAAAAASAGDGFAPNVQSVPGAASMAIKSDKDPQHREERKQVKHQPVQKVLEPAFCESWLRSQYGDKVVRNISYNRLIEKVSTLLDNSGLNHQAIAFIRVDMEMVHQSHCFARQYQPAIDYVLH